MTASRDEDQVAWFRSQTGATWAVALGAPGSALDAWEVEHYPTLRVVGPDGHLAGDTVAALRALLAR